MKTRSPEKNQANNEDEKNNQKRQVLSYARIYALASTVGFQIAIPIVVGILGGRYLDRRFGTEPWLMVVCLFLGIVVGIVGLAKLVEDFFGEGK